MSLKHFILQVKRDHSKKRGFSGNRAHIFARHPPIHYKGRTRVAINQSSIKSNFYSVNKSQANRRHMMAQTSHSVQCMRCKTVWS